ncbi:MAG: HAD-IA family hydrolase [Planctomycetes bacterium]|nr:HAD-IA family hydrolase [Planctomycetota bacterium]
MSSQLLLKAAVFDLDGLMFNTEDLYIEVGTELLRRRGRSFTPELLDAMMGRKSPVALQVMIDWHQLDATVGQLLAETDEIFPAILDAKLAPMPGLLDLLRDLEIAGIPKAVATSSRWVFASDALSRFSLLDRFRFILTAEHVAHGKPHPEIYQTAARRFGWETSQLMVLEDSENGCRAAVAAGAYTVAVPNCHSRRHDFRGVAFVADTLADPRIYAALDLSASMSCPPDIEG